MAGSGTWASEEDDSISSEADYITEGVIDPHDVAGSAEDLGVSASWQDWDCREGWAAMRSGQALILRWWRDPTTDLRHDRDLYVMIDEEFFPAPDKSDVYDWETVATYVATFDADDGEGACDVEVQVGTAQGAWFLRTKDDGGGSDEAPETAFATRDEAVTAAEEFAEEHDECDGMTAEDYRHKKLVSAAGKPDPKGKWCVYWETVGDDAHVVDRYPTEDAARAAAEIASGELEEKHPGGRLLCGYSVRQLVAGEWCSSEVVS